MNKITDDILCKVEKPSRYVGGELNQVIKNPEDVNIRFAFCFPEYYLLDRLLFGSSLWIRFSSCLCVLDFWPEGLVLPKPTRCTINSALMEFTRFRMMAKT